MKVVVVDYGVGNLGSIPNMLRRLDTPAEVAADPAAVSLADKLILPGVGAFDAGMTSLTARGLEDAVRLHVGKGRPLLGLCLGMQLLFEGSDEGGLTGLGFLAGRVIGFDAARLGDLPVPHMGWNTVDQRRPSALLDELPEPRFYFAHSFHAVCDEPLDVVATTTYGYEFPSVVNRGLVFGAQFHPEKSHRFGLQFLANFLAV